MDLKQDFKLSQGLLISSFEEIVREGGQFVCM